MVTFDMGEDRGRHVGVWSLVGLEGGWVGSPRRKSTALRVKRPMFASHSLTLCESGQASSLFKTHLRRPMATRTKSSNPWNPYSGL